MVNKSSTKLAALYKVALFAIANAAMSSVQATKALASSDADYSFTVSSNWQDCQQIGTNYQAVYAFETPSFYVNICQQEEAFFYYGEAKSSENPQDTKVVRSSTFIPAYPLENGNGFRAENGNVSYWIILPFNRENNSQVDVQRPTEAILTIKRNNRLVAVESSVNKYCHSPEEDLARDTIELQPYNSSHLATIAQHQDIGLQFSAIHQSDRLLPPEIFNSQSRFDFYRIDGELHRLATCN